MKRRPDDRLRTFDVHVTELLSESGGTGTWSVHHDLVAGTVDTNEPHRESLRSWLVAVRLLDARGDDMYLPGIIDLLELMPINANTRDVIGLIRRHWEELQEGLDGIVLEDSRGPIKPRQAFELLAYAHHLHRNAAKEARVRSMPPAFWELVRQQGAAYASAVSELAVYVRSVARDDPATRHLFKPAPAGTPVASHA
jgi:hypothetical protein